MKTNTLSAGVRALALVSLILSVSLLGLVSGCRLAPTTGFIFDARTNTVPVVTNYTVTVQETNALGTVETRHLVTWQTNIESQITYTVSTNAAALTQTAGRVTNLFAPGWGELAGALGLGVLSAWARFRSSIKKGEKGNAVLAQGIETLLAIVETTPQGAQLAAQMKLKLAKEQGLAGVANEIARIVETYVDNDAAREAARKVISLLPPQDSR